MPLYYVNAKGQPNGDHEVHRLECSYMPDPTNCVYLGEFPSCHMAVAVAKKCFPKASGCYWCSRECHKS